MDNAERLLTSSSKSWNAWRKAYNYCRIEISNLDKKPKKLNEYDLSYCKFSNVSFAGLDLNKLKLNNSIFNNCSLHYLNLKNSNLESTEFNYCNFVNTTITNTILLNSKFHVCHLFNVLFKKSNLTRSYIATCNLQRTNFETSNIIDAYFTNCMLENIQFKNIAQFETLRNWQTIFNQTRILPDGDIIGWKKCSNDLVVKLLIPKEAKRSSAFGRKCRCEYAKVLEIKHKNTNSIKKEAKSCWNNPQVIYKVGETVKCDKWNKNWMEECAEGIHFFITEYEAKIY